MGIVSSLVLFAVACGGDEITNETPDSKLYEFVPGMYRAEFVEVDGDCEPALTEIIEASEQPKNAIVQAVWHESESFDRPVMLFDLAMPRIERSFWVSGSARGENNEEGVRVLSFAPGEQIVPSVKDMSYSANCLPLVLTSRPEVRITQGTRAGVFEVEIESQYDNYDAEFCHNVEVAPRTACTERFVIRYELIRECPLNCTAIRSGRVETRVDIFPEIDGDYGDETVPEELFQCVPVEEQFGPFAGGECPEEFITP